MYIRARPAAVRRLDDRSWIDVVPGWVPDHGALPFELALIAVAAFGELLLRALHLRPWTLAV